MNDRPGSCQPVDYNFNVSLNLPDVNSLSDVMFIATDCADLPGAEAVIYCVPTWFIVASLPSLIFRRYASYTRSTMESAMFL
jgi:hypothetical protein